MSGTFQGPGTLQFTPDNKKVTAYSGAVSVNNTNVTLLEFTTTSYYLDVNVLIGSESSSNDDLNLIISLDNETIYHANFNNTFQAYIYGSNTLNFIITPFTAFKLTMKNTSASTIHNCFAVLTGKANGTIEQFDLEVKND